MQRVCAWCGKQLGEVAGEDPAAPVTHGICDECNRFIWASEPGSLRTFLNMHEQPVVCVDSDCRVMTANDPACAALGKVSSEVGDLLFGEVVLCPYALKEPGCGQHEHCLACTVRTMVNRTFETGAGVERQAAYVDRTLESGDIQRLNLVLSSEQVDGVVLVQIDGIEVEESGTPGLRTVADTALPDDGGAHDLPEGEV